MPCFRITCRDTSVTITAPTAEIASVAAWSLRSAYAAEPCADDPEAANLADHGMAFPRWPESFIRAIGWRRDPGHTARWNHENKQQAVRAFARGHADEIAAALESLLTATDSAKDRQAILEAAPERTPTEWRRYQNIRDEMAGETLASQARGRAARFRRIARLERGEPLDG